MHDRSDVVTMRNDPRSARALLDDVGDGAEADLLGTTPPRALHRRKERQRGTRMNYAADSVQPWEPAQEPVVAPARQYKRLDRVARGRERDWKGQTRDKADSLPAPDDRPAPPPLVESGSRFMSLSSRLKCRELCAEAAAADVERRQPERDCDREQDVPESRVTFHKTFSLLINMGNIEKGCRRAISREEQVWQNELKDLIWLELQAKLAGRSLAQQDAYLCAQRNIVPAIVQNIIDYRFESTRMCRSQSRPLCAIEGSREDLATDQSDGHDSDAVVDDASSEQLWGCLSFNCQPCSDAVGTALREVGALLDSFFNAVALYPSSKAMTLEHPLVATQLFKNRVKAMCLWYNTALHMRLKVMAVRRLMRSMREKARRRDHRRTTPSRTGHDEQVSRQSSETSGKQCQVRFDCSSENPTDSSNSESSHSEGNREEVYGMNADKEQERNSSDDQLDSGNERHFAEGDESGGVTPEIVISTCEKYATTDTNASNESGYASTYQPERDSHDVYRIGSLEELTALQLLNKCDVSPYRTYHYEILKTQGVRTSMKFIQKLRKNVLNKVHLTFERLDRLNAEPNPDDTTAPAEVFDTKDDDKTESPPDKDAKEAEAYELRRYGCWSDESLAMRLPSYRNHFLLLSTVCMEAVHDYLTMRLETRPEKPSCLTVKQLIHELKEGLDIATEIRAAFVRNIEAALYGYAAAEAVRRDLWLVITTFDATVETVLKQYLSYLTTMSATERMPRACLESEWAFTARLARRVRCAAVLAPVAFTDIACNQLSRIQNEIDNALEKIEIEITQNITDERQMIFAICRFAQSVYAGEREATLQAAQWARALAARLARAPPPAFRNQRQRIFESLMCIRDATVVNTEYILEHSRESSERSATLGDQVTARVRELLLQVYKLGFEIHKELQRVVNESNPPRGPSANSPRRPCPLSAGPLPGGPSARAKLLRSESIGEDGEPYDYRLFDQISSQKQTSIELLLSGEKPSLSDLVYPDEGEDTTSQSSPSHEEQWAAQVARAVIGFAKCWMKFVMERCDRGRGLRPRWASQGLEFLMLACSPCNTKHLTEKEFEELKKLMDECISHVIGSRSSARPHDQCLGSPTPQHRKTRLHSPVPPCPSGCVNKDAPLPLTPPTEQDTVLFHDAEPTVHRRRVIEAVEQLDRSRDEQLRAARAVGHVREEAVASYEPKLRQVTFKWQRGLKIGAGTFGKVYTVVNTETGQLLAMKELGIACGDRRALQRAANELQVLEGVIHPHLVRYYGCEVHREEMLIFMELCVEGSLEALLATAGPLSEPATRRYTKQLLSAVAELHNRNIAHRDIKSGNIFLTNEGHCLKLGDFGCAVKIRANTTALGELQGCVGTQAYMAPEVFMKSSGHGRAADVWSLGCVVTEMASGKRPFSEYDSNYQIMFVVGMGGRPTVPESLSEEGAQFCHACLTHDPDLRPRAEALLMHHFLMVKSDGEDCNCEPAYFMERKPTAVA